MSLRREFFQAVKNGEIGTIHNLLQEDKSLVLSVDEKRCTALYHSASNGDKIVTETLINFGAEVNAEAEWAQTPLHVASDKGYSHCCRILIQGGADVDHINANGDSPLHLAAYRGNLDVCKVLIQAGARIRLQNRRGKNAIEEARSMQHYNLSHFLQSKAERINQNSSFPTTTQNGQVSPPRQNITTQSSIINGYDLWSNNESSVSSIKPIGSDSARGKNSSSGDLFANDAGDFGNPFLLDSNDEKCDEKQKWSSNVGNSTHDGKAFSNATSSISVSNLFSSMGLDQNSSQHFNRASWPIKSRNSQSYTEALNGYAYDPLSSMIQTRMSNTSSNLPIDNYIARSSSQTPINESNPAMINDLKQQIENLQEIIQLKIRELKLNEDMSKRINNENAKLKLENNDLRSENCNLKDSIHQYKTLFAMQSIGQPK